MSETEAYITKQLRAAFHQRIIDLGYWCPRCDIEAFPNPIPPDDQPLTGGDGWCPICGLNPRDPRPKPEPRQFRGLLAT